MAELTNKDDAIRYARRAFQEYWKVAAAEFPENMQMSFDQFYAYMVGQRNEETIVDFGKSVYRVGQNWGQSIDDAWTSMQEYARRSRGQVSQYDDGYPRLSDFYDALLGKMSEWPVSRIGAAFGNVAKETLAQTASVVTTAAGGYLGFTAIISVVGIFMVIMSFRKR